MAVNKNFVVKNGLEVADTVIYATASSGKVGIGSTLPSTTLEVRGQGIKSPDGLFTGILTATSGFDVGTGGTVFNVDGARGKIGVNVPSSLYAVTVAGLGSTAVYIQSGDVDIEGSVSVGGTFEVGTGVTIKSSGITITRSSNVKVGSAVTITNSGLNVTGVITSTDAFVGAAVTINSSGINLRGDINLGDNDKVYFGQNNALEIYSNGTAGIIKQNTSNLFIRGSGSGSDVYIQTDDTSSTAIAARHDGGVEVFYDNSKKFETTDYGAGITGGLNVTGISTLGTTQISGGIVTSTSGITTYYGDGSYLTGLSTSFVGAIGIQSAGTVIGAATTLNFVGSGNTFLVRGNTIDISIQGGGAGGGVGTAIPYPNGTTSPFYYLDESVTVTQDITLDDTNAGLGSSYIVVQEPELIIPGGTTVTVGAGKTLITDLFMLKGRPTWDLDPEFNTVVVSGISTLGITQISSSGIVTSTSGITTFFGGFVGDLTGDVTGTALTATSATRITVADESTDPSCFVVFVPTATGNQLPKTGTNLTFDSSTGTLSATAFSGDGSNLSNTGATLSGASGSQRVVLTSLTSGTMTSAATEAALAYDAATNTLSADVFSGNLTGDVTGNADTATAATRITLTDQSADTTCNVVFCQSATGDQLPHTGSNLTFNSSTGALTATSFVGSLTGNADTATNATNITLADESSDTTCFPVFATAATGNQAPKTDSSALTYNASTGTLAATNVNSTSDANLKENVETIVGSIDILKDINGVRFVWKDLGTPSVGVIAQEVEQVLPELVSERSDNGTKSVNYNGLVGVLIEAVKELSSRVESLENQLNNQ